MDVDESTVEAWRRTLVSGTSAEAETCPRAERFYPAVRGELDARDLDALVEHAASCSACALAWRIARRAETAARQPSGATLLAAPHRWRRYAATVAALAAMLVLVIGLEWRRPGSEPALEPGVTRRAEPVRIESALDGETLARSDAVLRWRAPEEGLRYELWVTSENLEPIVHATDLERPQYRLSPERLRRLDDGARLLWRVETTLRDGSRLRSKTFISRLE